MPRTHDHATNVKNLVEELAQAEVDYKAASAASTAKKEEQEKEIAPLLEDTKAGKTKRDNLRERVIAEGLLVEEKEDLHPALTLVERAVITFDDAEMFEWCVLFNPSMLEIKRENITQHVNFIRASKSQTRKYFGLDGKAPLVPMPVKYEKVPSINISKKIVNWLPVEEEVEPTDADRAVEEARAEINAILDKGGAHAHNMVGLKLAALSALHGEGVADALVVELDLYQLLGISPAEAAPEVVAES